MSLGDLRLLNRFTLEASKLFYGERFVLLADCIIFFLTLQFPCTTSKASNSKNITILLFVKMRGMPVVSSLEFGSRRFEWHSRKSSIAHAYEFLG